MRGTPTVDTGVLDAPLGFNASPEDPNDGPHGPLGAKSRGAIAKRKSCVNVREAIPSDGEENGVSGIELKPPIPATEVQFEHKQSLAGVHGTAFFDEGDNSGGSGQEQFPKFSTMQMSRNI